jgi:Flp pilus assembly protein TadD
MCNARRENYAEAARHFEAVTQASPADAEGHYQLALAYEKLGRFAEASRSLEEALSLAKAQELRDQISQSLGRLQQKR